MGGIPYSMDVVYSSTTNSMIASINGYGGNPNGATFEQFLSNGATASFAGTTRMSGSEIQMAAAEPGATTAFQVGDVYTAGGQPGQIAKISDDGNTIVNPWVTLPNEGPIGKLCIDTTGVWGGDLIAATTNGDVWSVTPLGTYTEIASGLGNIEGLATIPDNPARYGPLAGTILAGSGDFAGSTIYSITAAGAVTTYNLTIGDIEEIYVVPANANFYGLDLNNNLLLGASASQFSALVGEIVVVREGYGGSIPKGTSGLYRFHWDGTRVDAPIPIALTAGSSQPAQWEGCTFTPFSIFPLPPTRPTTGLPNWPINLENSGGTVIAKTTTDARGNYAFTNVAAGTYIVAEVPQPGWTQFAPSAGTYVVTVTSDQVDTGLDFGNSENAPAPTDPGPVFSSQYNPSYVNATVGQKYSYPAVAADADHDQITYSLGLAPAGMIIDPTLGVIDWTPSATQTGFQNVDVQANDGNGNIATQYYSIAVSPADLPPVITTAALPDEYPDVPYSYQVTAVSPFNYPITFSLAAGGPSWLAISSSGLLTSTQTPVNGNPSVTVLASDNQNPADVGTRTFTLQVVPDPGGGTIQFTYPPPLSIQLGRTYVYNAVATDTADYPLSYNPVAPYPIGMAFVTGTTEVTWVPTATQLGDNPVTIMVSDGHEFTSQTFHVWVSEQGSDQPPTILPPPPPAYAVVGDLYTYSPRPPTPAIGP